MHWPLIILLTILTLLNSLAVVALIRQVGLLHLRIKPVGALRGEGGLSAGTRVSFADDLRAIVVGETPDRILIGFFTPTCGLCGPLMSSFRGLARTMPPGEAVVLATDADRERAAEYLRRKRVALPLISAPKLAEANQIPGAPFAMITDSEGRMIVSGIVNTLENIESLLETARRGDSMNDEVRPEEVIEATA